MALTAVNLYRVSILFLSRFDVQCFQGDTVTALAVNHVPPSPANSICNALKLSLPCRDFVGVSVSEFCCMGNVYPPSSQKGDDASLQKQWQTLVQGWCQPSFVQDPSSTMKAEGGGQNDFASKGDGLLQSSLPLGDTLFQDASYFVVSCHGFWGSTKLVEWLLT